MSDALVARQPICDRRLDVVGYELLYRSANGISPELVDGDHASASVAVDAFVEIGIDRMVGDKLAFLNMTRNFIVDGHWRNLPRDRVVLEVLEHVKPEEDVLAALRDAKAAGYTLALDDVVYSPELDPFLALVDIVKVEIPALDRAQLKEHAKILSRPGVKLLAEKVETHAEFEMLREIGYDWFQGFFFCRPNIVREKKAPTDRLSLIRVMARMQATDVDIDEIREIIERDVSLSYLLLRVVNSAKYALLVEITSIQHAIALLGMTRIKRYVTLLLMTQIDDKPRELMRTALVRGRVCEILANESGSDPDAAFCVGLLSVLDALTDLPMREALNSIPLAEPLEHALLDRTGPFGKLLGTVFICEGEPIELPREFSAEAITNAYVEALSWAEESLSELASFAAASTTA